MSQFDYGNRPTNAFDTDYSVGLLYNAFINNQAKGIEMGQYEKAEMAIKEIIRLNNEMKKLIKLCGKECLTDNRSLQALYEDVSILNRTAEKPDKIWEIIGEAARRIEVETSFFELDIDSLNDMPLKKKPEDISKKLLEIEKDFCEVYFAMVFYAAALMNQEEVKTSYVALDRCAYFFNKQFPVYLRRMTNYLDYTDGKHATFWTKASKAFSLEHFPIVSDNYSDEELFKTETN